MTCNTTWLRGAPAAGALISNLRQHREVPMTRKHQSGATRASAVLPRERTTARGVKPSQEGDAR
jgi:hypothetical protein